MAARLKQTKAGKPIEGELTLKELRSVVGGGRSYSPANKRRLNGRSG